MVFKTRPPAALVGLVALFWLSSHSAADEDSPSLEKGPQTTAAENRRPDRPGGIDNRKQFGRDQNRRMPAHGDARRDDRRHPNPNSGRGPQDPAGPTHWSLPDTEWLRTNDPEMYKLIETDTALERQTRDLGIEYRRSPAEKQDAIKQRLQGLVLEQFDVRQERRNLELQRLEEELRRIRQSIEKRDDSKQSIVVRRTAELLGEQPQF